MILPKGWVNPKGEEFMPEATSRVRPQAAPTDQPERGGVDGGGQAVGYFQAGGLGGLPEGQGQPRRGRGGRSVHRGVRGRLEEQPLQDLESDVLGELLPTAGASRRDPEGQWWLAAAGDSHGRG